MSTTYEKPGLSNSPFMEDVRRLSKNKVAVGLASLAGIFGVVELGSAITSSPDTHARVTALEAVDGISQPIAVMPGTNLRSTPDIMDQQDQPTNIVATVPEGQKLIVEQPMTSSTEDGNWVAVTLPGTNRNDIHNKDELANRTVWISLDDPGHIQNAPASPNAPTTAELNANVVISENGGIHAQGSVDMNSIPDSQIGVSHYEPVK